MNNRQFGHEIGLIFATCNFSAFLFFKKSLNPFSPSVLLKGRQLLLSSVYTESHYFKIILCNTIIITIIVIQLSII